jgi:hypothetical protein
MIIATNHLPIALHTRNDYSDVTLASLRDKIIEEVLRDRPAKVFFLDEIELETLWSAFEIKKGRGRNRRT